MLINVCLLAYLLAGRSLFIQMTSSSFGVVSVHVTVASNLTMAFLLAIWTQMNRL